MRQASISVLEAICHLCRGNQKEPKTEEGAKPPAVRKTTNKTIREYYDGRQGSGLPFFKEFAIGSKGASQKSVYRNVKTLEGMGLASVERKKAGGRRYDLYSPTKQGMECLRRESLRKKVTSTLPGLLEIIQAPLQAKLMTLEK